MACDIIIQMIGRNAGCTKQPVRCWIKPANVSAETGAKFDPILLGWQEDIGCVAYNIANQNCVDCESAALCVPPVKNGTSVLIRAVDNTATLNVNYAAVTDSIIYRVRRLSDLTIVWSLQTTGGFRSMAVNYEFPAGNGQYRIDVERVGYTDCKTTEVLTIQTPVQASLYARVDPYGNNQFVIRTGPNYVNENPTILLEGPGSLSQTLSMVNFETNLIGGKQYYDQYVAPSAIIDGRHVLTFTLPIAGVTKWAEFTTPATSQELTWLSSKPSIAPEPTDPDPGDITGSSDGLPPGLAPRYYVVP